MSAEGRRSALAAMIVVVIHGAVIWVLLRTPVWSVGEADPSPVLRVRWIERMRPALRIPPPAAHAAPVSSTHSPVPSPDVDRLPTSPDPTPPPPEAAMSAPTPDYLAQGAAWAAETAPATDFRPGLTASRVPRLPGGTHGGRFRMREPTSLKQTVEKRIGRLFGGPDYTTDPCPRMHDNVHGLLPDTSAEGRRRLEWELREYRERCRP